MKDYGKELILDLIECDPKTFTRKSIKEFFVALADKIDMQAEKLCWWDDLNVPQEERETESHLVGTSAVQFIRTSSIVIHTLDLMKNVYLNIFSCKDFNANVAKNFSVKWFKGKVLSSTVIRRRK